MPDQWTETCQRMRRGEIGRQVELQGTLADTMQLAINDEDTLIIVAFLQSQGRLGGFPVQDEDRFAEMLEMRTEGSLPGSTAHLVNGNQVF